MASWQMHPEYRFENGHGTLQADGEQTTVKETDRSPHSRHQLHFARFNVKQLNRNEK